MIRPVPKPKRPEKIQKPRKVKAIESNPTEDYEQMAVVDWLRWHNILFSATANGIYTHPVTMTKMKRLGVAPGLPDILIFDRPRSEGGCYPDIGVALEMKRRKGGVATKEQHEWLNQLAIRGWKVKICFGADDAIKFLESLYGRSIQSIRQDTGPQAGE